MDADWRYGCMVYELMTGSWPQTLQRMSRGAAAQDLAAITDMDNSRGWPRLEIEHMGAIVHKCWNGEYASAEEVKAAVKAFLEGLGWEIEGNDDLKGLCAADLFPDDSVLEVPPRTAGYVPLEYFK
ncbi:hypothetical protein P171DRAFT_266300 [Karstenula rhodostoma CBS 690.94]|uniref:Uncharacterized protein n=1 Tax=Karstenula rhodostoma CBS 690.94 TaxID=1392251 RepID=A0A9P4PI60_9PLEO|nr:hypothetical protein P171DRAFT_266300 [Karstenula rhodostoma CBS 690.94]